MDDILKKGFPNEDADSSIDISTADVNLDNSINYETADEGTSRYFSVNENESTLEGISDMSLQVESEQDTLTESQQDAVVDSSVDISSKSINAISNLSNISMDAINKLNLENENSNNPSSGVDIFDDNESSVDGHELVIDDDPQPSEKSDDCQESGTEASTDMQYKYDDNAMVLDILKNKVDFSMLKKDTTDQIEIVSNLTEVESDNSQLESLKDFTEDSEEAEVKALNYNFPEGSHRVNLLIDGNNVEAINIGQEIYIYTDGNGELTAFQVIKDDGNLSIKYLHVGTNEDGNIEVYEEDVKEVPVVDNAKDKDAPKIEKKSTAEEAIEQQKINTNLEKISQSLIKAVMDQDKKTRTPCDKVPVEEISSLPDDNLSTDKSLTKEKTEEPKSPGLDLLIDENSVDNFVNNDDDHSMENNLDSNRNKSKNNSIIESKMDDVDAPKQIISNESPPKELLKSEVQNHLQVQLTPMQSPSIAKPLEPLNVHKDVKKSECNILLQSTEVLNSDSTKIDESAIKNVVNDSKMECNDSPKRSDFNENGSISKNTTPDKIGAASHSSIDSDDEFGDEYIEGEPVTGDSEMNWMDQKPKNDSVSLEKMDIAIMNNVEQSVEPPKDSILVEPDVIISKDADIALNGNIIMESKMCSLSEGISLIDSQLLSSGECEENQNDINSDKITLHSFEDTVVKSVNLKVKLHNDHENNIVLDNPIFADENVNNVETDIIMVGPNVNKNLNSNIKSYIGKKSKFSSPQSKSRNILSIKDIPLFATSENHTEPSTIVKDTAIDINTTDVLKIPTVDVKESVVPESLSRIFDIYNVTVPKDIEVAMEASDKSILVIEEEESTVLSPSKSLDLIIAEDATLNEQSPRNKSRQPRKQVFTPVPSSDIEMIFTNTEKDAKLPSPKLNSPKSIKSYLKAKARINDSDIKSESNISKIKKKIDKAKENKIVDSEDVCPSEPINKSIEKDNESGKVWLDEEDSIDINKENLSEKIDAGDVSSTQITSTENDISLKIVETEEVSKNCDNNLSNKTTDTDNDLSFRSIDTDKDTSIRKSDTEDATKIIDPSPNLSNSAKRKRGRPPKKLISSVSSTIETVILNVDGSVIKPLQKKVTTEDTVSEINSPSESGKRKKGRPKKFQIDESPLSESKSDVNMNDSSKLLFDDSLGENICPICAKNFRSRNVLLKHAKHCNGVISPEMTKLPKRRKLDSDDSAEANMIKTDSEPSITNVDDVEDTSLSKSTILIDDSVCDSSELPEKSDTVQEEAKPSDDTVEDAKVSEDTPEKNRLVSRSKTCPERNPKNVAPSPMSRLTKILNIVPTVNKIIKCEICGKTFRQLPHMLNHRKKHDMEKKVKPIVATAITKKIQEEMSPNSSSDSILKCEICKKGFRKLHHLVQHREVHINAEVKSRRASVASVKSESEAGFRCDTCDKSFRKLHHLVEHRELHAAESTETAVKEIADPKPIEDNATCNGCGKSFRKRHHMVEHREIHCSPNKIRNTGENTTRSNTVRLSITSSTSDDSNNCDICGKSYRKLHHMIEHREVHGDSSSKQNEDNKTSSRIPVPDILNTKDIIHECSRCYMVFPNINSLNKHVGNCLNKKLLRKSTVTDNTNKQPIENKGPIRRSLDIQKNKTIKKEERISVDSKKSDNTKPTAKVVKTALPKPDVKIKKPEKTIAKPKTNPDTQFKYMINPTYKSNTRLSTSTAVKVSPKTMVNSTRRKSEAALVPLKKPNSKLLETIVEEASFRYSFPKAPKQDESDDDEPTSSTSKKAKDKPVLVATRKSLVANTSKRKSTEPTLLVKRKSIGGRKSLGRKSLDGKSLPKTKPKLQLRCCGKVFESQALLAIHRKSHTESRKSHKCDCGKQFSNDVLLRRHIDTEHTPPKSFKCQDCGVSVRTAAQFAKHKKSHETVSGASFAQPGPVRAKNSPRNLMKTMDKNTGKAKAGASKDKPPSATPSSIPRKRRSAHGGVPLSDKMRRALAGANF